MAEFALCLPLLMLMIFGLIQLAQLAVASCFSHYALNCALRAYTVHYAQGADAAMRRASRAMEQALAWGPQLSQVELSIDEETPQDGQLANSSYQGSGPLFFNAEFSAEFPLLMSLGGRHSASIHLRSRMLSEKTRETR